MEATPGVESISVSWSGSTEPRPTSYHNTSKPVGTSNRIDLANVTSYSFSGLDPSKTYYYSVVGYNKTGPSSPQPETPEAQDASITAMGAGSNTIAAEPGATGGYLLLQHHIPVTTSDNAFAVSGTSPRILD